MDLLGRVWEAEGPHLAARALEYEGVAEEGQTSGLLAEETG